jgi:general secretion pathway protein D
LIRFQPIARLNAILVLTQKAELLDKAEEWVMRLDRTSTEGDDFYVYRVENGKARDLAQVLNASFGGGGGGGLSRQAEEAEVGPNHAASSIESKTSGEETASPAGTDQAVSAESASTPSGVTVTASVSGGAGLSAQASGDVRITPNESNNTLLIKAPAREYRKILGILRRIDRPALQVLINATLAEVALNDNLKYGVQFYLQKNGGKSGLLGFSNGSQLEISPVVPGMNFIVGAVTDPKVVIDALATETAVRVVSSPSVVVLHNQSATLQVGDEVPIATRQASSVINPDAPLVNEIQFKNTGVILKVTPRISTSGLVSMEIEQEISAVSKTIATGADGSLTPTISSRRISSNIAVQSGQMVVLGGLISERLDDQKSRIPIIGKIPYLGDILGAQTDATKARTELVVFLRPTVIRNPEEAGQVAEAVRAGMQSMAPRPAAWDAQTQPQGTEIIK